MYNTDATKKNSVETRKIVSSIALPSPLLPSESTIHSAGILEQISHRAFF
jgi:hypothetical protein